MSEEAEFFEIYGLSVRVKCEIDMTGVSRWCMFRRIGRGLGVISHP